MNTSILILLTLAIASTGIQANAATKLACVADSSGHRVAIPFDAMKSDNPNGIAFYELALDGIDYQVTVAPGSDHQRAVSATIRSPSTSQITEAHFSKAGGDLTTTIGQFMSASIECRQD